MYRVWASLGKKKLQTKPRKLYIYINAPLQKGLEEYTPASGLWILQSGDCWILASRRRGMQRWVTSHAVLFLVLPWACLRVCVLGHFSRVWLPGTLWTVARQALLSMGFSRWESWSGLPCPPLGDGPDPRIEPTSPELQVGSLPLSHWEAQKERMTCELGKKLRKKWEITKRLKISVQCDWGPPRAEEATQRHLWPCPQSSLEGTGICPRAGMKWLVLGGSMCVLRKVGEFSVWITFLDLDFLKAEQRTKSHGQCLVARTSKNLSGPSTRVPLIEPLCVKPLLLASCGL